MTISPSVLVALGCAILIILGIALSPLTISLTTGAFPRLRSTDSFNVRVYVALGVNWLICASSFLGLHLWNPHMSVEFLVVLEVITVLSFIGFALHLNHKRCPFCNRLLAVEPSLKQGHTHVCTHCGKSW
jgi:hypothetical protein